MEMLVTFSFLYLCCTFCLGGEPYYVAEWSDVIRSCPDYENTYYSADSVELGAEANSDDDDTGLLLRGDLVLLQNIEEGYTMDLEIFKCTEIGDEPMYSVNADFCSNLQNKDVPWYPIVARLNSTSCPIPEGSYPMDGLKLSVEFAKDVITHDFCGEYKARLSFTYNMESLSCHMLSLAVVEKYEDEK